MRFLSIVAFAICVLTLPAPAASAGQSCVAVGSGTSRILATAANPADCCSGRMQCAQFLSTTRVVRPAHDQHT